VNVWLPAIYGGQLAPAPDYCGMSIAAVRFVYFWLSALGERRKDMGCDARLVRAAQRHADFLSSREDTTPSLHIGENGSSANERVRAEGYRLPDWFREVGNSVESCAVNNGQPQDAVERLLLSPSHRVHLLREGGFSEHRIFGVGVTFPYYVVLSAPAEEGSP
jgi:hypothetical protein